MPAATRLHRLPRSVHPAAWWAWAVCLAATASATTNPLLLVLLAAVVSAVVLARRGDGPWAGSFRLYLVLAVAIVVLRLVYRVLLGGGDGGTVLLALPEVPAPWVGGTGLLGDVTSDALLQGLQDGLRLAAIVVCVGAANSLANPKRLLAAVPGALYELGTVLVVSVTVFAQLGDSLQRVRRARLLRSAAPERRAGSLRGLRTRHRWVRAVVVPVLTDALDRSLQLAASMDARGYGRQATTTPARRRTTALLLLVAVVLLAWGGYAVVSRSLPVLAWASPGWARLDPGWLVLLAGVASAVAGLRLAGRDVVRTRYRPDRWRSAEWLVLLSGAGCLGVVQLVAQGAGAGVLVPGVRSWPTLTPPLLAALALGVLPAVLTPRPALTTVAEGDLAGGLS